MWIITVCQLFQCNFLANIPLTLPACVKLCFLLHCIALHCIALHFGLCFYRCGLSRFANFFNAITWWTSHWPLSHPLVSCCHYCASQQCSCIGICISEYELHTAQKYTASSVQCTKVSYIENWFKLYNMPAVMCALWNTNALEYTKSVLY